MGAGQDLGVAVPVEAGNAGKGRPDRRVAEIAVRGIVAQQGRARLQAEGDQGLIFVDRHQKAVAVGVQARHGFELGRPLVERHRRQRKACAFQQVGPVKQQARIDIPRHRDGAAADGCRAARRVEHGLGFQRAVGQVSIKRRQGVERGEFRDPGIAERNDVGQVVGGKGRQQLFVRRTPRQGLNAYRLARVFGLIRLGKPAQRLAFDAHRPNAQGFDAARAARKDQRTGPHRGCKCAPVEH